MKSQYEDNFAFNSSFEYHSGGKMAKNLSKVFSNEQNAKDTSIESRKCIWEPLGEEKVATDIFCVRATV